MTNDSLHIVCFDNPYPPNYGGIVEVFFKIKALHQYGVKIYLHCFVFSMPRNDEEIKKYVKEIYYYPINKNPLLFFLSKPFSQLSRTNSQLIKNIEKIKAPILYESIKASSSATYFQQKEWPTFLRLHNIEQDYYKGIAIAEKNVLKKIIWHIEAIKYKRNQKRLKDFKSIFTLSYTDTAYAKKWNEESCFIPVFHGNQFVPSFSPFGEYFLYHGDLRISDNIKSVLFLINIFKKMPDYKLVIASGTLHKEIEEVQQRFSNISFVLFYTQEELFQLLSKAHCTISWSFQTSGTKLKVVNALFNSRFAIINQNIIDQKEISDLCIIVSNEEELKENILKIKETPFTDFERRKTRIESFLNDRANAQKMINIIFGSRF